MSRKSQAFDFRKSVAYNGFDCRRPADWYPLLILTVDDTLDQARRIFTGYPELPRLIANGCAHVGGKWKADQVAQRICERQDLGGQVPARFADALIVSRPFASGCVRWTLTIVPSMRAYSKPGSPDKVSKIFSKTPLSAHRRKRFQTENQFPKYAGRSRPGAPVRRSIGLLPQTDDCPRRCVQGRLPCQEAVGQSVPIGRPSELCESRLSYTEEGAGGPLQ